MIQYAFVVMLILVVLFIYNAKSEQVYNPEASDIPSVPLRYQVKPPSATFIPEEIDFVSFEDANARNLYDKKKDERGMTQADIALEATMLRRS